MSMNDPATVERNISARLRVMFIVWVGICTALLIFVLLSVFVLKSSASAPPFLFWMLAAISLVLVVFSFSFKRKALATDTQSTDDMRSAERVQTGYIVAWLLCEAAGIFGMLSRAITDSPYFYLPFVFAALGLLLHMPRREQLTAATFRNRF